MPKKKPAPRKEYRYFINADFLDNNDFDNHYNQGPFNSEDEAIQYAENMLTGYEYEDKITRQSSIMVYKAPWKHECVVKAELDIRTEVYR